MSSVDINFNPKVIFGASSSYMRISGNISSVGTTLGIELTKCTKLNLKNAHVCSKIKESYHLLSIKI